ncbi:hypothetical protein CDL15_Pgr022004 [Punica granatum]|uniref:Uncharacterized protein n=1 Tax=Punica granatum TaxID=22663 RepID=A0A218W3S1_PUNGR|nr:hypothetical protein CDL15_Pgr022004 [Punica granatum]
MSQCTSLGSAHRGWMTSEVVSVRTLNGCASVLVVDIARGGRLARSSSLIVLCDSLEGASWRGVLSKSMDVPTSEAMLDVD